MRRALATVALVTVAVCGPLGVHAATASPVATSSSAAVTVLAEDDEPLSNDGNDDTGKYGLIGLTGLFGLFGYKKYKDHRATRAGRPVGGVDEDLGGSTRL